MALHHAQTVLGERELHFGSTTPGGWLEPLRELPMSRLRNMTIPVRLSHTLLDPIGSNTREHWESTAPFQNFLVNVWIFGSSGMRCHVDCQIFATAYQTRRIESPTRAMWEPQNSLSFLNLSATMQTTVYSDTIKGKNNISGKNWEFYLCKTHINTKHTWHSTVSKLHRVSEITLADLGVREWWYKILRYRKK